MCGSAPGRQGPYRFCCLAFPCHLGTKEPFAVDAVEKKNNLFLADNASEINKERINVGPRENGNSEEALTTRTPVNRKALSLYYPEGQQAQESQECAGPSSHCSVILQKLP